MRLQIDHVTDYVFEKPAPYGLQELRLSPRSDALQSVAAWTIEIEGLRREAEFEDHHGNRVQLVSMAAGATSVRIRCVGEVDTTDRAGVLGPHKSAVPLWFFLRETPLTAPGERIRRLTEGDSGGAPIPRLHALMARLADALTYEAGQTDAATSAEAALAAGRGVCQDHAHAFAAAARRLGFPARYVSGYLSTRAGEPMRASHAWGEAHVDGLGWVGFDPANRQSPDARYVRLATGLDYRDAAPVSGLRFGAGGEALTVSLQIQQQ